MVPAHFHDVTDDEMKSNLVKNYFRTTPEPLLNHSENPYLSRRTYPDIL